MAIMVGEWRAVGVGLLPGTHLTGDLPARGRDVPGSVGRVLCAHDPADRERS
ncbi:hypothetical protein ACL02T_26180 [Pseudonocardia sp. RS010]|uniref:hypothetical protein n=1 Tax=Pseudonocardia sp. RS010 TaxID=3385979 RepID=UPI0039A35AFC